MEILPNPVQNRAVVSFSVNKTQKAKIEIYNIMGGKVKAVFEGEAKKDVRYEINFDASGMAEGIYVCTMQTVEERVRKKVAVVK